jgi:hypothetical protein
MIRIPPAEINGEGYNIPGVDSIRKRESKDDFPGPGIIS